jgi:hypothetical protein
VGELDKVAATRAIVNSVDWECEVLTNYSEVNLGCKRRVYSGIDWVFEQVAEAIILEDDCVPNPSFFRFCAELLERYRHDTRIMAISGDNFQFGRQRSPYSYYFSRYNHIWGWATWRRAWRFYDVEMEKWPEIRDQGWLSDYLGSRRRAAYWNEIFELVYRRKINTWDYQWMFACWLQSGLCILPSRNLVSNVGFGANATHTASHSRVAALPIDTMKFPLVHPSFVIRDPRADAQTDKLFFNPSLTWRVKTLVKRWL